MNSTAALFTKTDAVEEVAERPALSEESVSEAEGQKKLALGEAHVGIETKPAAGKKFTDEPLSMKLLGKVRPLSVAVKYPDESAPKVWLPAGKALFERVPMPKIITPSRRAAPVPESAGKEMMLPLESAAKDEMGLETCLAKGIAVATHAPALGQS